ncbi:hypothetical protein HYT45_03250 [Candidatus Uhrbacteria bacterium]|nr:hypothetical protein [Candidatus Uhrbacteria bacterium]
MKKTLLIAAIIVAAAVGLWLWKNQRVNQEAALPKKEAPAAALDSSAKINQDIQAVEVNNLDQDFKEIDSDSNRL